MNTTLNVYIKLNDR